MKHKVQGADGNREAFHSTRWSLVRQAAGQDEAASRMALETICRTYWYPIYACMRREGRSPEDAEDLTQGFLADMVEKDWLRRADAEKGRLRTFLLTLLHRYAANQFRRSLTRKRGSGTPPVSFDSLEAEKRYGHEPADHLSPDRLYQRGWALALLESTLTELRDEYTADGRGPLFAALRPFLGFGICEDRESYQKMAEDLGMKEGTVRTAVCRLRSRFRSQLFRSVAATLATDDEDEIKAELTELLDCL